jgi:uncharacterized membrane protein
MTSEPSSLTVPNPSREIPQSRSNPARRIVILPRLQSIRRFLSPRAVALAGAFGLFGFAQPAAADFRLCNNTGSRVGIAIGYKDSDGWTTEGWWNLPARSCETLLRGALVARFYYIYAVDYERGGEWSGQAFMCTRDKEFTIRGIGDCLARGYERTGFFEVDTSEQRSWTVQLTESSEEPSERSSNPSPLIGPPAGRQLPAAAPLFPKSESR